MLLHTPKKKARILEIEGYSSDACSFYRGRYPLVALRDEGFIETVDLVQDPSKCDWDQLCNYDILFIQRPYTPAHELAIIKANNLNKKIWIDFDDNVLEIPKTNPAYKYRKENNDPLYQMIDNSNMVTVTTPELKTVMSKYQDERNVVVIPNCLNDYVFKVDEKPPFGDNNKVIWRGGESHEWDLHLVWQHLRTIIGNSSWDFNFFGKEWVWQNNNFPNYKHWDKCEIITFYLKLIKFNPSLCIIPLEKIPLNEAKSEINWIEATYSGAACLIPDFGSYKTISGVHYNEIIEPKYNTSDFFDKLLGCLNGVYDLEKIHNDAWNQILKHRLLSNWQIERKKIIDFLME
jgi:hypothetical protein